MSVKNIFLSPITNSDKNDLADIYKGVFKGHPWHEDLICANALEDKCSTQYTPKECFSYDLDASENIVNDCRNQYEKRGGDIILLKEGKLETCVGCGEDLNLIEYYPDYRNHHDLIDESLEKKGFVGYLAKEESGKIVGFSWGYTIPNKRTISVDFTKINPLIEKEGIDTEKTFYISEIGVIDSHQGQGIGGLLSRARLFKSHTEDSPEFALTRTINPLVHRYLNNIFSGNSGKILFEDPETRSPWFAWNFKDFDEAGVLKRIAGNIQ